MRVVSIVGARPQFVKLSPIHDVFASERYRNVVEHIIVHTGQHYDRNMSGCFFDDLAIPAPDENLGIGSGRHGEQTGSMLGRLESFLIEAVPDLVLLYGDTNSTLAGAIAAAKINLAIAHIEAGLRSHRKTMPEEINRVLTDHVSSILFCPTAESVRNLVAEGIARADLPIDCVSIDYLVPGPRACMDAPWIVNVGDVMKDAVLRNVGGAGRSCILSRLGVEEGRFAVATVHRADNTDNLSRLRSILAALETFGSTELPVILPLHPRTRSAIASLDIDSTENLRLVEPLSYADMLQLVSKARLVLTDSGGLQKESFLLRVPCITLREETEWVELVEAGWNRVVGADEFQIVQEARAAVSSASSPSEVELYGDGQAAERIAHICVDWWERADG